MTMHLVRGMTSLNTKKAKKAKLTLGKIAKYEEQMRKHNKEMKRLKCPNLIMNLQEYIDYYKNLLHKKGDINVSDLRLEMQKVMQKHAGVFRNDKLLQEGVNKLKNWSESL